MKVKIKKFKTRPAHWNCEGLMDELMGKTIEVIGIGKKEYNIEEMGFKTKELLWHGCSPWYFKKSDFVEAKKPAKKAVKKSVKKVVKKKARK